MFIILTNAWKASNVPGALIQTSPTYHMSTNIPSRSMQHNPSQNSHRKPSHTLGPVQRVCASISADTPTAPPELILNPRRLISLTYAHTHTGDSGRARCQLRHTHTPYHPSVPSVQIRSSVSLNIVHHSRYSKIKNIEKVHFLRLRWVCLVVYTP